MKREPLFKTEAELCAAFIAWGKREGWTAYAETAGWDIVLVASDGTQIGVQAKMRVNLEVLQQAVEGDPWNSDTGPDFRVVLAPRAKARSLCDALGLTLVYWAGEAGRLGHHFQPDLPSERDQYYKVSDWHYANPVKRCVLPQYIPDVPAGVSAPVQLTRWKIRALKIVAVLDIRGHVTRADFKRYGVDHRRWINENDWLAPGEQPGQFVRGPALTFDRQHPEVFKQVVADVAKELQIELTPEAPA